MHDFHVQFQTMFLGTVCLSLFSSVQFRLDSAFVKSGIIQDSVSVVSLWPRLTKLTSILIILKKKKDPIIVNCAQLKWKFWSPLFTMNQTSSCASKLENEMREFVESERELNKIHLFCSRLSQFSWFDCNSVGRQQITSSPNAALFIYCFLVGCFFVVWRL